MNDLVKQINQQYLEYKQLLCLNEAALKDYRASADLTWGHWYEVSLAAISQIMARVSGFDASFDDELKTTEDWINTLFTHLSKAEPDFTIFSEDTEKGQKSFLELAFSLHFNLVALEQRNKSISEIVESVRNKNPQSEAMILEAISIDPSVIASPTIEQFIRKAAEFGNEKFLLRVSSAMVKKSPRPRAVEFDELRLMMGIIAELQGKNHPSLDVISEVNDLLKLVEETGDTVEAIRYHLKVRRKDRRSL